MNNRWNYFLEEEVAGLDCEFVAKLDMARHMAGTEFIITSGKRTPEHNEGINGVEDSSHLTGLAVDLACSLSGNRFKIVSALLKVGFKRIGIYDKHIHVDDDKEKAEGVIWIGMSH